MCGNEGENNLETGFFIMIQKQAIINDNMRQKQTVVQEDNMEQEQYSASVKVEDTEEDRMMDAAQENSLMLVRGMVDDDMEHIADMKEQFSQTIDPILRMYNAAMCATTARLEIIEDEFKYRKLRCPIHHIDTRLKSAKSILGKLQKKDLDLTLSAACNNIYDIAGVRVVCSYIKDVYLIRDRLMAQDDIHIMEIKDYIEQPKGNGYRSLHIIIRVPVYFMNKKQMVPVELQIRTLAMDLWASLEHDIKYKSLYQDVTMDFSDELKECSRLIYEAEEKMEIMSRMDEAMQELVDAIKFSEEYIRYQDIKNRVHNQPQLEQQIHAFRHKNYLLQNSDGNVDLYDATDKMEQEYREFRKNPLVAEYLAAENAFCRVVQKVNWTLIEELDFEVGFEE